MVEHFKTGGLSGIKDQTVRIVKKMRRHHMGKRIAVFVLLSFIAGCTYAGERNLEDYLNDPKTWVQDPHFENYQQKRDELEGRYLRKEISYAEYLEQRTTLDDRYAGEVAERNQKIMDDGK
jgi:hypothetical protein